MNILQLTTRFRIGGIASYIEILSSALKARGHSVTVAASWGDAVELLESENIPFVTMPLETKFEWHPKLWFAGRALERLIHEEKIDLVHAHTRVTQILAERVCRKLGRPLVTTCHGFYPPRLGRRLFPGWGDRVIAISPEVADHLKNVLHVDSSDIRVILNAVPVSRLQSSFNSADRAGLRKQLGLEQSDFVLGSVARLEKVKGHRFLLEAALLLKEKFPRLKLLLVGDGSEKVHLEKFVAETGLQDRIIFVGQTTEVISALSVMDAFVSPQTWEEGFGLSIAEAMVCGLPVIASNTGALRRLIREGETGMLVEPGNTQALAKALSEAISNDALRTKIARQGREFASAAFAPERMVEEMEMVYADVLNKSRHDSVNFGTGVARAVAC